MSDKTLGELILDYFHEHPGQPLEHSVVVDAVSPEYERRVGHLPRDPWRQIRHFAQQGALVKIKHGVYMYDPDSERPNELHFFPAPVKQLILKRDGYRCVVCGQGRPDGVEVAVDHVVPLDKGGDNSLENGQTLCYRHNNLMKNYSQTEAGKRFFIKLYEEALTKEDNHMVEFCLAVFEVYDRFGVDGHIAVPGR
jgi:hypothetical protein